MTELTVCAVICTRNRPDDLARVLQSLTWQDRPCAAILVIDDSDADLRPHVEMLSHSVDAPVTVLTKDEPGLTASRNLALDHVTQDITLFLDDDVVLRPDYVSRLVGAFEADPDLVGAGGSIDDDHEYELQWLRGVLMVPGRLTGRVYRSGWSSQTPKGRSRDVDHLIGCNMAFRTAKISDHRFADHFRGYALGEDLEFTHRLREEGHRLTVVGDARLWHLTDDPRHDYAWGYREVVIRPIVGGRCFSRPAFVVSALVFAAVNARRNPERARGNLLGIADVLRNRPPRDLQTRTKVVQ